MQITSRKWLAACAMSALSCAAQAAPVTHQVFTPTYGDWSFSNNLVGLLNATNVALITGTEGAFTSATYKTNPTTQKQRYFTLDASTPLREITIDDTTGDFLSAQFGGSVTISNSGANIATTGGSLTLSNWRVDFIERKIYSTITGGNDVGLLPDVALWTFDAPTGNTAVSPGDITAMSLGASVGIPYAFGFGNQTSIALPNLKITTLGFDLWQRSQGYNNLGVNALNVVQNFGTVTISNVPESSTYAMLLTGLMVVGAARRRATKR